MCSSSASSRFRAPFSCSSRISTHHCDDFSPLSITVCLMPASFNSELTRDTIRLGGLIVFESRWLKMNEVEIQKARIDALEKQTALQASHPA
jgi:hypothetical protein